MSITSLLFFGCSNHSSTNKTKELPYDAYSETLPENATEISEEEFNKRLEAGEIIVTSRQSRKEQSDQQKKEEANDDETIASFRKANPNQSLAFLNAPAENDPTLAPLGDGNYLHTISLNNGATHSVITMSQQYIKHQFAEAVRTFPTWNNQLNYYKAFYDNLPADWRQNLELVPPDTIENSPDTYSVADIMSLNRRISEKAQRIISSIVQSPNPEGYPSDPAKEIGYFDGSDSSGSSYTNPACGFKQTGIRNAYEWPMKYYVTSVKDQRGRGTCVSFANTSAIETHVAKKFRLWTNLSEQAHYNRMKLTWEQGDFGDGFSSDLGFSSMVAENWLLPFEDQWPYNPSIDRTTGIAWCIRTTCEQNSNSFQACESTCGASFPIGSQNHRDCVQTNCRNSSPTYQTCKTTCEDNPNNHYYYYSCQNYADTCSDSTHQSELVCAGTGSTSGSYYYKCAYNVPEKNPNSYGYRITSAAQFWDRTSAQSIEFSFVKLVLALALGNPVVIGHPVTTAFDDAADDGYMAYVANDTNRGGHGLHAVGYIDNNKLAKILPNAPPGTGGGYIIVKNSWSNCWGDGGYIYIPYQSIKDYTPDATVLHGVQ